MRLKYDEERREFIIQLEEEPAFYCDEKLNHELPNFLGHSVEAYYYSEQGKLVQVKILGMHPDMPLKRRFGEEIMLESEEVVIPEKLPWRKYIFTYGKENKIPKICADHYNEIYNTDDQFLAAGRLIIQRRDEEEMDKYEIRELREAFYKDAIGWGAGEFYDWNIASVYKDKKLYFWMIEERLASNSEKEFMKNMKEMLELTLNEVTGIERRELGFDITCLDEKDEAFAIVCICDEEGERMKKIEKEELIRICKNTSKYKKRKIVVWNVELSNEAKRWAESENIKVQDIHEFVAQFCMRRAEIRDDEAEEDQEEWCQRISDVFR
jgi:hypothetical protein